MFDSSATGNDNGVAESGATPLRDTAKVQYTVKGIHRQTVEAMRQAANREGMKIGSWVSVRLREAAERSLSASEDFGSVNLAELHDAIHEMKALVSQYTLVSEEIQKEIIDLGKFQKTMMTLLIERTSPN
jgi:hypothetical protein